MTVQATLFAPSNEALLRTFPQATLDQLLADAANATSPLQALVLLHSVPSPVFVSVRSFQHNFFLFLSVKSGAQ